MKQFLVLLLLIFVQPAIAQQVYYVQPNIYNICDSYTELNCTDVPAESSIDRAMNICKKHKIVENNVVFLQNSNAMYPEINNHPYYYDDKWKNCSKIENKWNESETAKKLKAEKEQEQRDLDFVNKQAE